MDKFECVISLTSTQVLALLEKGGEVLIRKPKPAPAGNGAWHNGNGKRRPHHSRIFTIVKRALHEGPQPSTQLRMALKNAGLSPESLGPALTQLQRRGQVVRHSPGVYGLARPHTANASQA